MKCPYCQIGMTLEIKQKYVIADKDYSKTNLGKEFVLGICPECQNLIVLLKIGKYRWVDDQAELTDVQEIMIIHPQKVIRYTEMEIPQNYRDAANEANSVLYLSPKASAALSRRLLQHILHDEYKIKKRDLSQEIDEFLKLPNMPTELTSGIDAIRNIGNFAAHPIKYTNTGEIVEVENGEADWLLDIIGYLFEHTFVKPAKSRTNIEALNKKLAALGKGELKGKQGV